METTNLNWDGLNTSSCSLLSWPLTICKALDRLVSILRLPFSILVFIDILRQLLYFWVVLLHQHGHCISLLRQHAQNLTYLKICRLCFTFSQNCSITGHLCIFDCSNMFSCDVVNYWKVIRILLCVWKFLPCRLKNILLVLSDLLRCGSSMSHSTHFNQIRKSGLGKLTIHGLDVVSLLG